MTGEPWRDTARLEESGEKERDASRAAPVTPASRQNKELLLQLFSDTYQPWTKPFAGG
jgi:hypothetical protein